MILFEI